MNGPNGPPGVHIPLPRSDTEVDLEDEVSRKDQQIRDLQESVNQFRTFLVRERARQTFYLKWSVCVSAGIVAVLITLYLAELAVRLLQINDDGKVLQQGTYELVPVSLVVAPILSLTAIVIVTFPGVFRGTKADDLADAAESAKVVARTAAGCSRHWWRTTCASTRSARTGRDHYPCALHFAFTPAVG